MFLFEYGNFLMPWCNYVLSNKQNGSFFIILIFNVLLFLKFLKDTENKSYLFSSLKKPTYTVVKINLYLQWYRMRWKRQQTNKQKPGYGFFVIWHISKISLLPGRKGGLKFNNEGSHISTLVLFLYFNFLPLNPLPLLSLLFLFILIPLLFSNFYSIKLGQIWKKYFQLGWGKREEFPI